MKRNLFLLGMTLFLAAQVSSKVYYLRTESAPTAWSGKPSEDVFTTFSQAWSAALANNGDTIWISSGLFTTSAQSNPSSKSVHIFGGFAGTENSIDERAMVSGGKPWEFVNTTYWQSTTSNNFFSTTAVNTPYTIDGITFQNFGANPIMSTRDKVLVQRCSFLNNRNTNGNGACIMGTAAIIKDCYFKGNRSNQGTCYRNTGSTGGNLSISGCLFEENEVAHSGYTTVDGGIIHPGTSNNNSYQSVISDCIFRSNVQQYGGSSMIYVQITNVFVKDCLFYNNLGRAIGSKQPFTASNLTVVNNQLPNVLTSSNQANVFVNSSIIAMKAGSTLSNSVIWGNQDYNGSPLGVSDAELGTSAPSYAFSLKNCAMDVALSADAITGGATAVSGIVLSSNNTGNTAGVFYPCFSNPSTVVGTDLTNSAQLAALKNNSFTITSNSKLINAGDNDKYPDAATSFDLAGNSRVSGSKIDVGCYEYQYPTSISTAKESSVKVYEVNGRIIIDGSEEPFEIYSIDGGRVNNNVALGRGIYLVVVEGDSYKVVVK